MMVAENRILRTHLRARLRLTDPQRSTLAEIGKRLRRKTLQQVACVAKPDPTLAWYRKLCAQKFDGNRYLFETRRCGPFTPRRIQQIVQQHRHRAGITQPVHPHLFRHQMLTFLTSRGLSDAQIQLISGHQSKKSLEVYQHLSLESVERAYRLCCNFQQKAGIGLARCEFSGSHTASPNNLPMNRT